MCRKGAGDDDESSKHTAEYGAGYELDGDCPDGMAVTEASIEVPSRFMSKVVGKNGAARQKLEAETNTTLVIPRRGQGETVRIRGKARAVASCQTRIELLVDAARARAPPTHFLSIPLLGPGFEAPLTRFKDKALELGTGLAPEMFTDPTGLHLTLGVLKLYGTAEIAAATAVLAGLKSKLAATVASGLRDIVVAGVEYMNDDPSAVDVLYAKARLADGSAGLERVAADATAAFSAAGLLEDNFGRGDVKLHATLINSKRRHGNAADKGGRREPRQPFDARQILRCFKGDEFGRAVLGELHLSKMAPRGGAYYEPEHVVSF